MKTKSVISLFTMLFIISLFVEACNMPGAAPRVPPTALPNPEVPDIIMVRPINGSIYPIGNSIMLATLVRSISSLSINEITFLVNGASIGAADGSQTRFWTPPQAGEYYIQSRAVLSDRTTSISDPVRICVMSLTSGFSPEQGGYLGQCEIPTRIPNPASSGDITINAFAAPNIISFSTNPACLQAATGESFVARVDDPQDLIVFATLDLYMLDPSHPFKFFLNWVTTRSVNQKEYRILFPHGFSQLADVPGGSLRWVIKTLGRDGQELQMTGVNEGSISIQSIQCSQQHLENSPSATPAPLQIFPSVTPTAVMPPTFTLNKNAFCRKGPDMTFPDVTAVTAGETVDILNVSEDGFWYFIHWKKFDTKCWVATGTGQVNGDVTGIKVLVGPSLPAPKPAEPVAPKPVLPPACTSYADASSCTTHGCSWDKPTSTCK